MRNRNWRLLGAAAAFVALTAGVAACGSDGGGSDGATTTTAVKPIDTKLDAIQVPSDYPTIQKAVDAAKEGDLILVDEGVYKEAVDVTTPNITIRGVSRTKTILEGSFKLENGIRILDTDGVVVENMTARDYTSNGFYWTGSDHYRGSYLTAYRNGNYGIYAFDAYHGQFDHSLGSGSPDAGFYIGECFRCDAVITDSISEYNGLGYSGTNSGGDLYIVNSEFRYNRAGVVPNTGAYELCYPNRETTIVGNLVHDNNNLDNPGISVSLLVGGIGIVAAGTVSNDIERNLVYNHDRWGMLVNTIPESDAADNPPPASQDSMSCEDAKKLPLADPKDIPALVLFQPRDNRTLDNTFEASKVADIGYGIIGDAPPGSLNNCWSGNTFETSQPPNIEAVAPCDGTGTGDYTGQADITVLADPAPTPPDDAYQKMPEPSAADQPDMPDALTAPAEKFVAPEKPDLAAIKLPSKPAGN